MLSKQFLKILCIFSCFVGAVIGLVPLIPAFTGFAFFLLLFLIAPLVLIYFKKLNILKTFEMERCLVIGAVAGAVACIGFATIYFPLAFILQLILKVQSFVWIKILFTNIGFLIPMVFFIALISAIMNAFSAFLVVYFYTYFGKKKQ